MFMKNSSFMKENVLWRVYHGELQGYNADEIVLMIGTNNIGSSTNEEIVEGLCFLFKQIQVRQPNAELKVIGILPRRGQEDNVKKLNEQISAMVNKNNWRYIDVSDKLMKDGKIVESYFSDGLHPNDQGYALIAPLIVK